MSIATTEVKGEIYRPESDERKADFELIQRQATALSKSTWIPKHLIGKNNEETVATCVGLAQMADKWDMSAQMVAGETYSVHGKIGFQGKLYAALANAHGNLNGGLRAIYSGKGDSLAAVIFGSENELTNETRDLLKRYVKTGDSEAATDLELSGIRSVRLVVGTVKTDQAMWTKEHKKKLFYSGATKWCRRFMPDLVLGAISVEDIEKIDFEARGGNPVDKARAIVASRNAGALPSPEPEKPEEPSGFNFADFEAKLAACKTTGEINAVFKALDVSKLTSEETERINVLGLEREQAIGAIQD